MAEAAIAALPGDTEPLNDYCRLQFERGTPVAAFERLLQLAAVCPADPAVHHNLGVVRAQLGQFAEAVTSFQTSLTLRPGHPPTLDHLADALRQRGQSGDRHEPPAAAT